MERRIMAEFEETVAAVIEALGEERLLILTRADLRERLRREVGVDIGPYKMFGVCDPTGAKHMVARHSRLGSLAPSTVVVFQVRPARSVMTFDAPRPVARAVIQARPELAHPLAHLAEQMFARLARGIDRAARALTRQPPRQLAIEVAK